MGQTTQVEYALYTPQECVESMCGSLKAAKKKALDLKKKTGMTYLIYRYDRSGSSSYNELVATI